MQFLMGLLVGILILNFVPVHAATYTLNDVVQKLEKSETYAYLNNKDKGTSAEVTSDNHSIKIIYTVKEEATATAYLTEFYYMEGILSYTYSGNKLKPTEDDLQASFIDAMWIAEISSIVAGFHGYTDEALKNIEDQLATYTLQNNGLEVTTWSYKQEDENGHFSMSGYDTFKIDINNFKLTTIGTPPEPIEPPLYEPTMPPANDNSNSDNESTDLDSKGDPIPNENVENPNTGVSFPILALSVLGVIGIICFSLNKKEKHFRKI